MSNTITAAGRTDSLDWILEHSPLDGARKCSEVVLGLYGTVCANGTDFSWNVWDFASGTHRIGGHAATPELAMAEAEVILLGEPN